MHRRASITCGATKASVGQATRQRRQVPQRSEEHTSELQSRLHLVCRLLLEKKKKRHIRHKGASRLPTARTKGSPQYALLPFVGRSCSPSPSPSRHKEQHPAVAGVDSSTAHD